jgi:Protein of unknown function (DUF3106)
MNGLRRMKRLLLAAGLCAGLLCHLPLSAQETAGAAEPEQSYLKSPVDLFRELLAMTPAERKEQLAIRPPEIRERIEAKLTEYQAMSPDEREWRLQATELHWYLLPLMKMPATNRVERLALIPPGMRELVQQRLDTWTILPPQLANELLENEQVVRLFAQAGTPTPAQLQKIMEDMPQDRRKELEAGVQRWQQMPEDRRRRLCRQFDEFFDLNSEERQKALTTLSEAERSQMERTLREFQDLPKDLRETCIRSFRKFADMSLPEREFFLKNAELWKAMSPDERQAWRELVKQVPNWPPLPAGFLNASTVPN